MRLRGPASLVSRHFVPFQAMATLSGRRVRALTRLPAAMQLRAVAQEMLAGPWLMWVRPAGKSRPRRAGA